jgi:cell division septation protein DedD
MPPPAAAAEPVAPVKKVPVAKAVPSKREASAAPAVTASSGAGFVAVLSSQKSRMDALKIFANMQEKYGTVLSSRTPDVQEANLGEKGMWYRLVVGPPGSRDAAASLCTQLKAAGYAGCWVTAY